MKAEAIEEAKKTFGPDVVSTVFSVVRMSDPDGAWALFQDMEMEEETECLEMLYFSQD
jgi:hypothetical protein